MPEEACCIACRRCSALKRDALPGVWPVRGTVRFMVCVTGAGGGRIPGLSNTLRLEAILEARSAGLTTTGRAAGVEPRPGGGSLASAAAANADFVAGRGAAPPNGTGRGCGLLASSCTRGWSARLAVENAGAAGRVSGRKPGGSSTGGVVAAVRGGARRGSGSGMGCGSLQSSSWGSSSG